MNIFEDLIEELKEENLLEETVIDVQNKKKDSENSAFEKSKLPTLPSFSVDSAVQNFPAASQNTGSAQSNNSNHSFQKAEPENKREFIFEDNTAGAEIDEPPVAVPQIIANELNAPNDSFDVPEESHPTLNQAEFFRKRATDEVTSLQMVEHVLSGVERDFLNITPKLYDDLEVKKALHSFLQLSQNINSPEQANAEFILLQETETWYSALSQKDKNITVSNLRRYCETTRPALSSQALAALARFYRNAPFSESVRSKFDLVMTRYFARENGGDIRRLTLSRDEMIEKLNEFYAEWSSIPLYATEEDESNIVLSAIKFEEFITEAEEAENVETLYKTDFFRRLKNFKDDSHENFFAPLVTATSIESSVRIGNRYLELLLKAHENPDADGFEEKYSPLFDELVSEVICKSVQISSVFAGKFTDADVVREIPVEQPVQQLEFEKQDLNKPIERLSKNKNRSSDKDGFFKVNKLLLAATFLTIFLSVGLYLWVEYFNEQPKLSESVKTVNLENSSFKEYIQTARINNDMFYGIVNPGWDGLSNEKKEDFLRKVILVGGEKGYKQVTLMNKQGRSVGYASTEKVEVYNP